MTRRALLLMAAAMAALCLLLGVFSGAAAATPSPRPPRTPTAATATPGPRTPAAGAPAAGTGTPTPSATRAPAAVPTRSARPVPPGPVLVRSVLALDVHQHAMARFHRGDRISLRIRWAVSKVASGEHEAVIWVVHFGRQVVYRHFHVALAKVGRWRWSTTARIPATAHPGVYTFEGKVVVGKKASWRVMTFRVVP